jgi:arylsulfatase A-like enzyme
VVAAYMQMEESQTFARDEVVRQVRPVYMGLIEQLDHHIGRVIQALKDNGQLEHTLIVFTNDHGDFGGDHHLGEKDLFHDQIIRSPLMVFDPRAQADATRGQRVTAFAESVDVVPTALDALQIRPELDRTQGRSLMPWIHGDRPTEWRDSVFAEIDYSFRRARLLLNRQPGECRGWMVRERQWKYVRWQGFAPQLFNLENDPDEYVDLGKDPRFAAERQRLDERLHAWLNDQHPRLTMGDDEVAQRTDRAKEHGIYYGTW